MKRFLVIIAVISLFILAISLTCIFKRKETYKYLLNQKYTENDICIYIFLWKKVSKNALKLYDNLKKTFDNVIIIDCDETVTLNKPDIIKLDDTAYYGKQFDTAIKHSQNNKIVGIFVGDIDPNKLNSERIKKNLLYSMNNNNVGIYSPNDKRSDDKSQVYVNFKDKNIELGKIDNTELFRTSYTDCTCWFFIPDLVSKIKNIDFIKTNLGWGIDLSLIKLAIKNGYNVVKDYSVNIYNPPGTNYNSDKALKEMDSFYEYLSTIELFKGVDLSQRNIMIKPKIHLIFFGDKNLEKTKNRLLKEATDLNFFDSITAYDETVYKDKPELTIFAENNKRGYGYWLWKSFICLKKMGEVDYNDIIFYCDAGCTIENKQKLLEYCEYALKNDLVGFTLRYKEKEYTKGDLFEYLDAVDLKNTQQIMASVFIFKKTPQNIDFFNRWFEVSIVDNYHLIDDSPSILKNDKSFIEHRHDQSIFSLLIKKYQMKKFLKNEIDINEPDYIKGSITAKRLKY
jgi:hypothetical protein